MALIHEKIYGSGSLSDVNIKEYIESLVTSLFDVYETNITLHSDIESVDLNMEISIPLGLIINELVNNVIKYAFPNNEKGNLYIKFKKEVNKYILIFKDDGVGLPDDFDLDNLSSLGLIVVTNLTLQIGGIISVINCEGTGFKIEFEDY
jgi:two-component sensor histidine kinase